MNRKQRRALNKLTKKDNAQAIEDKVAQFQNLPDMCLTCQKPLRQKRQENGYNLERSCQEMKTQ